MPPARPTGQERQRRAVRNMGPVTRHVAVAVAATIEGDPGAWIPVANYVGDNPARLDALACLVVTLANVSSWTPDQLRGYASQLDAQAGGRSR